jgi:putative radical SAM enzyme (TIGR03279 family)
MADQRPTTTTNPTGLQIPATGDRCPAANKNRCATIAEVIPGSPADECGIKSGDRLLSVNGILPRDTIEYSFLTCGEDVRLRVLSGRRDRTMLVHKDCDANLGLVFEDDCFDGIKRCRNHCLFCFVDQLPPELRPSLYQKDDDYRLSFLHGNFLTMTNMDEREFRRIENLHLSPLYISVHATDPGVRGFLLGRRGPVPVLEQVKRLAGGGATMHIQVVLCPGINDGDVLNRTVDDLAVFWPQVASVGIVPVGLTRFSNARPQVRSFTRAECTRVIRKVVTLQESLVRKLGVSFVYLADEFFIRARLPFPRACSYDRFPQLENGIGNGRIFQDEFRRLVSGLPGRLRRPRRFFVATGRAGAAVLEPVICRLKKIRNLEVSLIPVTSTFFGSRISVTGLLTGSDLVWGLRGLRGEEVLLPSVMLKQGTSLLLDGMSVEQVASRTGCLLRVLEPTAGAMVEAVLGGA